jgi:hypothetical protein
MPIQVACPHCGVTGRLPNDGRPRRVLCPRCGMRFDLPGQPEGGPDLPPAVIARAGAGEGRDADPFGDPARSGFHESPTVDAEAEASPGSSRNRRTIITVKGSEPWGVWLASVSRAGQLPAAVLVELAPAEWAAVHGFPAPPEH